MIKSCIGASLLLLLSLSGYAHTRLVSPTPRNNNSGIKSGPCGGLARSSSPTLVQGGQMLTVSWEETIQHPGKFLISLSMGNDAGFEQNLLKQVADTKDSTNDLPHEFSTQVQIPNVACDSCTIQMIQSMEENPAAPTYYYSCADIKIVTAGSSGGGSGGTNTTQSTNAVPNSKAEFGSGCGLISQSGQRGGPPSSGSGVAAVALLVPFALALYWRRREALRVPVRSRSNYPK